MQISIQARGRIKLTEGPKYSRRTIDKKGTIQILDASHVMKKATLQKIIPETKDPQGQTRRRGTILTLLNTMNQQTKGRKKIPQVMRNMYYKDSTHDDEDHTL